MLEENTIKHRGREVYIDLSPFPETISRLGGFAVLSEKYDCYIVAVNCMRAPIAQRFILGHELAHVFLDHLEGDAFHGCSEEQEHEANKAAWEYYRAYRDNKLCTA